MAKGDEALVRVAGDIGEIGAADWDRCANPTGRPFDPFVAHAFLKALEDAGTIGPRTGWVAQHLVLEERGRITGVMPLYLKSHSKGEYIFDYGWAEAFERAGGRYYPKLQCAVPFTPVPGRRILVEPHAGEVAGERMLLAGAIEVAKRNDLSSLHVTFCSDGEWQRAGEAGLLQRTDKQFHWTNQGYRSFDDFLASLTSRKRKNVRKERQQALDSGIVIEHVTGKSLTEAHWDAFFDFYMDTGSRKWGRPYLNRAFFSLLGATMAERCLMIMARRNGRYVAGALNMIGGDCLYGRYWGTTEPAPFLHFEVCYYQAIDYAIAHKLARVEAGAQGEHKLARGYLPTPTYSVHWIADAGFRKAVARYLDDERRYMEREREALAAYGPYRRLSADDAVD
ncbi:MAG: GNAT family N-acetyltransferase [Hyphomicrobiaceae bacterium]|nr:GNAT family N-acetyltransferase [Hyphomicrobiaceae bacterium]